jgi:hypothetical protein
MSGGVKCCNLARTTVTPPDKIVIESRMLVCGRVAMTLLRDRRQFARRRKG